ncbi:histone acetyltransferase [Nematocida sp. LUAm3]|nr:histone acetyltransferase [Nematocida sp. LUAm3]KAI5175299.1 histone acetyltransferase [Nematocida sp. LUAm2]KAI5177744.1 histone acetyltransferase [Nematocida sp. LUAm1]
MFALPREAAQKIERNTVLKNMVERKEIIVEVVEAEKDYAERSSKVLLELKNLFQKQLPKMPKEYIARLVFDIKHKSMVIFEGEENKVVGGICFRLFYDSSFVEIVFCAVSSDSQIKGYGEFMMNMLKETMKKEFQKEAQKRGEAYTLPIYLLTYADNYAIGYFKKQGFSKKITFTEWKGKIKDYEGGTLMQGKIYQSIDYTNSYAILLERREELIKKIQEIHPEMYKEYQLTSENISSPMDIPGLKKVGFTKEMENDLKKGGTLKDLLSYLCTELQNYNTAWPFLEPVNGEDVKDYYTIIKNPMDLSTVEKKIENNEYKSFEEMDKDINLVITNCCTYNAPGTQYAKCAKALDEFYKGKIKWCKNIIENRSKLNN